MDILKQYVIALLTTAFTLFFLALFVYFRNRKDKVNQAYAVFTLAAFLWSFGEALLVIAPAREIAIFWNRVCNFGIFFIATGFIHFILVLLGIDKEKSKRKIITISYIFSSLATVLLFTNAFLPPPIPKFSLNYFIEPGPFIYPLFVILWFCQIIYGFYELIKAYIVSTGARRNQLKYLLIGALIGYIGGSGNYFLTFDIEIIPLNPFGTYGVVIYSIMMTYAILKYHLMDIEIFIKKTTLLAVGVFLPAGGIFIGINLLQPKLQALLGANWWLVPSGVTALLALALVRFINYVVKLKEEELSHKFNYRLYLKGRVKKTSEAKDRRELSVYIVRDITSSVHLDYVGLLMWDKQSNQFILERSLSRSSQKAKFVPGSIKLTKDNPLITCLLKEKKSVILEEIVHRLNSQRPSSEEGTQLERIKNEMASLNASVCVPSFFEDELLGILFLGEKLSPDQFFTHKDTELFEELASKTAVIINKFFVREEHIRMFVKTKETVLNLLDGRDHYTKGHTDRVCVYSAILGRRLRRYFKKIPNSLDDLKWAAQLHDIGKVVVSDAVLLKQGKPTPEEWEIIKQHPSEAIKALEELKEWLGENILAGVLHHHENYDGTGYPGGQKGEEIHIFARIIRVADAFDAMTTTRPYRQALSIKEAIEEIKRYLGIQFDPLVANTMIELYEEGLLEKILVVVKQKTEKGAEGIEDLVDEAIQIVTERVSSEVEKEEK